MAKRHDVLDRIDILMNYIRSVEDSILQPDAKEDICAWIQWFGEGKDARTLMHWFPILCSVFGFYISALQERVDNQKFMVDTIAAQARKTLERQSASKVTEAQAKAHTQLYPGYEAACKVLAALERLLGFLSSVSSGINSDVITAYAHTERLQMRQDS
jgi:uncharacterized protein (DUF1778 family)